MNPEEKKEEQTEKPNFFNSLKTLRTFQGDVEEVMGVKKTSIADIAIAEQKRREKEKVTEVPETSFVVELKNKSFATFGIGLFIFGCIMVAGVYYLISSKPTVVEQSTLVSYSKKINVVESFLTKESVALEISKVRSGGVTNNTLTYINFTEATGTPISIQKIFTEITPTMPPALVRDTTPEYMLGVYAFETNEPFLLISVSDFGIAYSGMLTWEKNMIADIRPIFGLTNTTNTVFEDYEVHNKDLRVLRGADKKIILLYTFLDKNTLLITTNENTFNGLLGKFSTSKVVR